jgi:hypothetical protein
MCDLGSNGFWLVHGVILLMEMERSFSMCELGSNFWLVYVVLRRMEMQR